MNEVLLEHVGFLVLFEQLFSDLGVGLLGRDLLNKAVDVLISALVCQHFHLGATLSDTALIETLNLKQRHLNHLPKKVSRHCELHQKD